MLYDLAQIANCCVCVCTGGSAFTELLEAWFPHKASMPSAYLVDTTEEALLLPDWLKLRMIRCHTGRLVDAGGSTHVLTSVCHAGGVSIRKLLCPTLNMQISGVGHHTFVCI